MQVYGRATLGQAAEFTTEPARKNTQVGGQITRSGSSAQDRMWAQYGLGAQWDCLMTPSANTWS
jgi:hypothetical protein